MHKHKHKFTKELITFLSHIFEEKKHEILIVAKSKHPSPYSSREFDRKKLTYSHFAHTLSTTEKWVRQKILHTLMCVSAGT